jgi:hypothetical protein
MAAFLNYANAPSSVYIYVVDMEEEREGEARTDTYSTYQWRLEPRTC